MLKVCALLFLASVSFAHVANLLDLQKEFLLTDPVTLGEFRDFKLAFGKEYKTAEETLYRLRIFKKNLERISFMNANDDSATYKVNKFGDISEEEFRQTYLSGYNKKSENSNATLLEVNTNDIPAFVDWRTSGSVSSIKNQGSCGSCWAFSAVGNVESQYAIRYGKVIDFSEQQVVDCDKVDEGCNGGLMQDAFTYISQQGGLMALSDYEYEGRDDDCRFDATKAVAKVTGFNNISTNETEIAAALAQVGPLAVALNANWLQFYFKGIFNPWVCSPTALDHGVLLVGYGTEVAKDYWIVKNSWGEGWGEDGFFRIVRGTGKCGINTDVSTAIIA